MIDFSLSEDQKMLQQTVRQFAQEKIRPVARELDRIQDPEKSFPTDLIKEIFKLGFHKILVPEKYGGYGLGAMEYVLLIEELGWGDAGVASIMGTTIGGSNKINMSGTEAQKERFLRAFCGDEMYLISSGLTEPTGGTEVWCPLPEPEMGVRTTAVRDGSHWVINGQKVFVSSAGLAKLYTVQARTGKGPNTANTTTFLVPADTPGVSYGKVEDKIGRRLVRNQELFLENVRVPDENIMGKVGGSFANLWTGGAQKPGVGHLYMGALSVGLSQAAYDEALRYAKERKIWGKPIIQHQLVGAKLVDMKIKIEAARAFVWKMAWAVDNPEKSGGLSKISEAAKIFPTTIAREVTVSAMEVFGGYGNTKELPLEKWVRDAAPLTICGFTNDVQKVVMSTRI